MDLSFLDIGTLLLIAHIFGVALGAGGAFTSDLLFIAAAHDRRMSRTELRLLRVASTGVIAGLALLIASGIGLAWLNPEYYLSSSKFLAKMSIVAILALNGIVFHTVHIPRLKRYVQGNVPAHPQYQRERKLLLISGALSSTSWASAMILGLLRSIPWSYSTLMMMYAGILVLVLTGAYLMRDLVMPSLRRRTK